MQPEDGDIIVGMIQAVFPHATFIEQSGQVWGRILAHLTVDEAMDACQAAMRARPGIPTPHDIIVEASRAADEGLGLNGWEAALAEVYGAIREYGVLAMTKGENYFRPLGTWSGWSSPEIAAAVAHVGGVAAIGSADLDDGVIRAQFREGFKAATEKRLRDRFVRPAVALPGGQHGTPRRIADRSTLPAK